MENSGSLSSSETKPGIRAFGDVSPSETSHGNLRRPAIGVSPDYDHEKMMAIANSIGAASSLSAIRSDYIREARDRFSASAVMLMGEGSPWHAVGRGAFKFRCEQQVTYFIGNVDHGIKIGISVQPLERLSILQTGSPVPLRILACTAGGLAVEREYHARFKEHRKHGEWFAPHAEILAEIERLNSEQSS